MPPLPIHLGDLHAYEALLLGLLAFGPFVVLAIVVTVVRRRDIASEQAAAEEPRGQANPPGSRGDLP